MSGYALVRGHSLFERAHRLGGRLERDDPANPTNARRWARNRSDAVIFAASTWYLANVHEAILEILRLTHCCDVRA